MHTDPLVKMANQIACFFGAEPERASPYSPSSRRYLNPVYIALDPLSKGVEPRSELIDYGKVAARKHRRDANEMIDALDKDGEVSGDDADRAKKKVEEVVADAIKHVDTIIAAKEKEILEV